MSLKGVVHMFVILTYDISSKRGSKVMKICKKYLHHVQKSVFEGMITEAKLRELQGELEKCVQVDQDAICVYRLNSLRFASKTQIGVVNREENFL